MAIVKFDFEVAQKAIVLLSAVVGAVVAAIKLKVFELWKEDSRTEMESHCQGTNDTLVWADYTIANIGDLPFVVRCVRLDLCYAKEGTGGHLEPDRAAPLATTFIAEDEEQARSFGFEPAKHQFKDIGSIGYLGKGERTMFTLRCRVKEQLPEVFFIAARWWRTTWFRRQPKDSFFNHMHVRESTTAQAIGRSATAQR